MPVGDSKAAPQVNMVTKALALLTALGDQPEGSGVSELARQVGYPLSTTHRILATLVDNSYARFDASSKRYSLGLRVFQLAQNVAQSQGFSGLVTPILNQISVTTREATMLTVLDGHRQLYVYCNAGPQQVSVMGAPGKHGPLHCTSQGKVLLAFAREDTREYLLRHLTLEPLGPNTITEREQLRSEVEAVRVRGFAIADEEHEAGIRAVGVPVLNGGYAIAALATAAPAYRMSVKSLVKQVPMLTAAAAKLAAIMPVIDRPTG